jgi:hypothetical protein
MLRDQPPHDIHRSARKHGHNELDRPVRIGLRAGRWRGDKRRHQDGGKQ